MAGTFLASLLAALQSPAKVASAAPPPAPSSAKAAPAAPATPAAAGATEPDLLALQIRVEALEASQGEVIVRLMKQGVPL